MKKPHYFNYLNQHQERMFLNTQKTSKQPKKQLKSKSIKTDKNKQVSSKMKNNPCLPLLKKNQNKENQNPNFHLAPEKDSKRIIKSQSFTIKPNVKSNGNEIQGHIVYLQNQESLRKIISKEDHKKKTNLSLTKCNFQPSHSSQNLYLVETSEEKQLIVCQKCSQMFKKRTKIADFEKLHCSKFSYSELVQGFEFVQEYIKKIKRIKLIQKENIQNHLNNIEKYYNRLIESLINAKQSLQKQLIEIYEQNSQKLAQIQELYLFNFSLLNQSIDQMEKNCINQGEIQTFDDEQINRIFLQNANTKIQISSVHLEIPTNLLETFYEQFNASKYCIKLFNLQTSGYPSQNNELIRENSNQEEVTEHQTNKVCSKTSLSPDFDKQLPFNVQFSATGSRNINLNEGMLSKASSSQELLIQSFRQRYQNKNFVNQLSNPVKEETGNIGHEENKNTQRCKTEVSTYRMEESKQEISCNKRNFIKQLHIEQENEFDDMICDEELTLSSSHPIHQKNSTRGRQSEKVLKKKLQKETQIPLSLSQLQSEIGKDIRNPSMITKSQNKNQISFQLDENLIIDGNILPDDSQPNDNYDIISPAFKAI